MTKVTSVPAGVRYMVLVDITDATSARMSDVFAVVGSSPAFRARALTRKVLAVDAARVLTLSVLVMAVLTFVAAGVMTELYQSKSAAAPVSACPSNPRAITR